MPNKNKTIAIAGATGFIGTQLTLKLLDLGYEVKALARNPESWMIQHENLSIVKGDIGDEDTVKRLLEKTDILFYLIHSLDRGDEDFEYNEYSAAMNTLNALNRIKPSRVIFLGGLGPEDKTSKHLRSRHLVGEILGSGIVPCSEFRASIVLGANSTSFEMIKALSHRLPIRPEVSWLNTKCQPISINDLLEYLIASLSLVTKGHQIIEIGGSNIISYGELIEEYMKIMKIKRPKISLPLLEQRAFLPFLDMLLPEFPEIAKKLFLSLEFPSIVSTSLAEDLFPDIKPMSVIEAMKKATQESSSYYPQVWQGDFWKEIMEQQLPQNVMNPINVLDLMKKLTKFRFKGEIK